MQVCCAEAWDRYLSREVKTVNNVGVFVKRTYWDTMRGVGAMQCRRLIVTKLHKQKRVGYFGYVKVLKDFKSQNAVSTSRT